MNLFPLIGVLLLSTAPVQAQPKSLYSDVCKNSDETFKACLVMFLQGGITALCEGVKSGFLDQGYPSAFVEAILEAAEEDDNIPLVVEAIELSKLMNPNCGI